MEKAFKFSEESEFYKDLKNFEQIKKKHINSVKDFFGNAGIEANQFVVSGNGFMNVCFHESRKDAIFLKIVPTENDKIAFKKMLCKPQENGLCSFRAKSAVLKQFRDYCIENKVVINLWEPTPREYFRSLSHHAYQYHRFFHGDILYVKINCQSIDGIEFPKQATEIKMSEFYNALEEKEKEKNA